MNVSLKYMLGTGATYNGLPLLSLSIGQTPITDINLLNAIRNSEKTFAMKGKILMVTVDEALDPEDQVLLANVMYALPDWIKIGKIHQPHMPSFMRDFNYLIGVVENTYWAKFKVNEIWYEPKELPKNDLDVGINLECAKYILPTNLKLQEAFDYIRASKSFYGILQEAKKTLEIDIL